MLTWDFGPFDNDEAADLAHTLNETARDEREELVVRVILNRAVQVPDSLENHRGQEAVGAAALLAGKCPAGEQLSTTGGRLGPKCRLAPPSFLRRR
ncbi:DUF4259 domain-containing protein [Streptomyces sp. 7R007]